MLSAIVAIVVILNGVLAGIFVGSCLVEHAMRTLKGPDWLAYKQAKEALFGPVMPIIFGVVLAASLLIAVVGPRRTALATTCVFLAVALLITVAIHLPLNKLFQGWSAGSLPVDWDRARRRWRNWNWVRSLFAVAAFSAVILLDG